MMAAARKKIWIIVALCLIGAGVALSAAGYTYDADRNQFV